MPKVALSSLRKYHSGEIFTCKKIRECFVHNKISRMTQGVIFTSCCCGTHSRVIFAWSAPAWCITLVYSGRQAAGFVSCEIVGSNLISQFTFLFTPQRIAHDSQFIFYLLTFEITASFSWWLNFFYCPFSSETAEMLSFTRQNCTIQRISQRNFCFGFGVDGEGGTEYLLFYLVFKRSLTCMLHGTSFCLL